MKLGDKAGALATLEEVLGSGFDEFDTMKKDSTLSSLGSELDQLISKFKKKGFGFFGAFGRK